jgi:hypothetical protein
MRGSSAAADGTYQACPVLNRSAVSFPARKKKRRQEERKRRSILSGNWRRHLPLADFNESPSLISALESCIAISDSAANELKTQGGCHFEAGKESIKPVAIKERRAFASSSVLI